MVFAGKYSLYNVLLWYNEHRNCKLLFARYYYAFHILITIEERVMYDEKIIFYCNETLEGT